MELARVVQGTKWSQAGRSAYDAILVPASTNEVKVKSLSHVRLFATPWTVAYEAPPSMGFSRQECWSGLPFPSPIILFNWVLLLLTGASLIAQLVKNLPAIQETPV